MGSAHVLDLNQATSNTLLPSGINTFGENRLFYGAIGRLIVDTIGRGEATPLTAGVIGAGRGIGRAIAG